LCELASTMYLKGLSMKQGACSIVFYDDPYLLDIKMVQRKTRA